MIKNRRGFKIGIFLKRCFRIDEGDAKKNDLVSFLSFLCAE